MGRRLLVFNSAVTGEALLTTVCQLYVCMYVCMYVLGALTLEQHVKRWLASCGFDRGTRTGKLEQPNAKRKQ